MPSTQKHTRSGFTLIELLLVIGIIAILAAVVIVAINPTYQLSKSYNAQRQQNIRALLDAFWQYSIDNNGAFQNASSPPPADCAIPLNPAPARKICVSTATAVTCDFGAAADGEGCVLSTVAPVYLADIPADPQDTLGGNDDLQIDYTILLSGTDGNRRLSVTAPNTAVPPEAAILTVTR